MVTTAQMNKLMGVQTQLLEVMKKLSPVLSTVAEEMENVGDSAKKTTKDLEETQTFLGKFIDGFLRKTTGGTGFFHRMMYGVDGYFIFKNRLDGMLSFIDRGFLRPIMGMGDKNDGIISRVLMGVNEDYTKMKDLIFGPTPQQMGGGGPSPKGVKKFIEIGSRFFKFGVTVVAVVAKYVFLIGLALGGVFLIMKLLKKIGVDGAKLKEIGAMMKDEFLKYGAKLIKNLESMIEGATLIFSALFGDGDFDDLVQGYWLLISGFFMGVWNLFLAIAMPLFKAYFKIVTTVMRGLYNKSVDWLEERWDAIMDFIAFIGAALALVGFIVSAIATSPAWVTAAIASSVIGGVLLIIAFLGRVFKPFANGGVTKSGLSLVGERGPELVRLPNGSRVHTNQESKRMMAGGGGNNITVNIQGRIGASDSELRQIAQKVGQMINKEINRTTSSRGLGA